uniref:Uncharacterized protein n=1 Tax=Anopheles maculatus TaxID=74869 RepID=A0A182SIA3_9DIPT
HLPEHSHVTNPYQPDIPTLGPKRTSTPPRKDSSFVTYENRFLKPMIFPSQYDHTLWHVLLSFYSIVCCMIVLRMMHPPIGIKPSTVSFCHFLRHTVILLNSIASTPPGMKP